MSAGAPPSRERLGVARAARASLGALLGFLGCGDKGPAPTIVSVQPMAAYNDVSVNVTVEASAVRPGLRVDLDDQSVVVDSSTVRLSLIPTNDESLPTVAFGPVRWISMKQFMARLPSGVARGVYDVRIEGPNGETATAPGQFIELGPDTDAPQVNVMSPLVDGILTAGDDTTVTVRLDDGLGQAHDVSLTTPDFGDVQCCTIDRDKQTGDLPQAGMCSCRVALPALPDAQATGPYWMNFTGRDVAGNANSSSIVNVTLAQQPIVTSFEPDVGSLTGGQTLTVRGRYFLPGSQVFIGDMIAGGDPLGGVVVDDTTITCRTQPHSRPEGLPLEVRSPAGYGTTPLLFHYTAPPRVRVVYPESGPSTGGIMMTIGGNDLRPGVMIMFGTSAADAQPLAAVMTSTGNNKITGCLPPGTGTVSVWAVDTLTGQGGPLPDAFTYASTAPDGVATTPCAPAALGK